MTTPTPLKDASLLHSAALGHGDMWPIGWTVDGAWHRLRAALERLDQLSGNPGELDALRAERDDLRVALEERGVAVGLLRSCRTLLDSMGCAQTSIPSGVIALDNERRALRAERDALKAKMEEAERNLVKLRAHIEHRFKTDAERLAAAQSRATALAARVEALEGALSKVNQSAKHQLDAHESLCEFDKRETEDVANLAEWHFMITRNALSSTPAADRAAGIEETK